LRTALTLLRIVKGLLLPFITFSLMRLSCTTQAYLDACSDSPKQSLFRVHEGLYAQ
jgi:hypothetical protein